MQCTYDFWDNKGYFNVLKDDIAYSQEEISKALLDLDLPLLTSLVVKERNPLGTFQAIKVHGNGRMQKKLEFSIKWRAFKVDIRKQSIMGSYQNKQRLKAHSQNRGNRNDCH